VASPDLATSDQPELMAPLSVKRPYARLDSVLLYGTVSLLLFGPLAFGAVEPWAIFVLQVGASSLLVLWAVRQAMAESLQIQSNPLFRPMTVFALLILVQVVLGLSSYRHDTVSGAMQFVVYGILVFLVVQGLQRTAQVKTLAWVLSGYGFSVALFALVHSLSSNGKLYWLRVPQEGGWIYGPYVNHNHYAGLMEMLFPIPLVIALTRHVRGRWKALPALAAVLMAATIFLSGSRGGMVAFLVQMVVLGILLGMQKNRRTALTAGAVLTVVAALMLWVGGEGLITRIISIRSETQTELEGGLRLTIDRDGLKMFTHRPIFGFGLGTFPVVYPQYRTFFTNKFINRAHDDYLQLLVEMGISGFAAMIWFIVLVYRRAFRKLGDWTWNLNGAVALACLLGCTGILIHSFVDSNLQIPANAALFYTLCAIGAADTKFGMHRRRRSVRAGQAEAADVAMYGDASS
jgi:O-antigen ligase